MTDNQGQQAEHLARLLDAPPGTWTTIDQARPTSAHLADLAHLAAFVARAMRRPSPDPTFTARLRASLLDSFARPAPEHGPDDVRS